MTKRIAMIAGSFDPVTKGHERMIIRAAGMFDEVIAVICENSGKKYMFDLDTRLRMLRVVCDKIGNARADVCYGLAVDYARDHGARFLVRGTVEKVNRILIDVPLNAILPHLLSVCRRNQFHLIHVHIVVIAQRQKQIAQCNKQIAHQLSPPFFFPKQQMGSSIVMS